MNIKFLISIFILSLVFMSCKKDHNCSDVQIQPAFIGFTSSDIDTFVLRKYKANDNFRILIDTFIVNSDYSSYKTFNDTINVTVGDVNNDGKVGILFGYDWKLYIPSTNQTLTIINVINENKTNKCGGFDRFTCACTNNNFSANFNNQQVTFPDPSLDSGRYRIFIHK